MDYNIKDSLKGQKLEEVIKRFAEKHPEFSNEDLKNLREFYKNATEKEINKNIYEASHRTIWHRWVKLSILILILGVLIACVTQYWWVIIVAVILALILRYVFDYARIIFLNKYG
jgi:uncharacterized membrane protein